MYMETMFDEYVGHTSQANMNQAFASVVETTKPSVSVIKFQKSLWGLTSFVKIEAQTCNKQYRETHTSHIHVHCTLKHSYIIHKAMCLYRYNCSCTDLCVCVCVIDNMYHVHTMYCTCLYTTSSMYMYLYLCIHTCKFMTRHDTYIN